MSAAGSAFISHDGEDANGVRAEVYVQKGTGIIQNVAVHASQPVANVEIKNQHLNHPVKGWVNVDSDLYKTIMENFDPKSDNPPEIEYRVESQRKLKAKNPETGKMEPVDRTIPMSQLRLDMGTANNFTRVLLVGVNGITSDEAVTHPSEDPSPGGRIPAQPVNRNTAPQDNANANQAPQGQTPQAAARHERQQAFGIVASEAPVYREVNEDGSRNLGSYRVQGATGIEGFTYNQLIKNGWDSEAPEFQNEVFGYAASLLTIVDSLQAYFTHKPANRLGGSHTRLRGVVFDIVENHLPFNLIREEKETKDSWYGKVGKLAMNRFSMILELDYPTRPFSLDAFLGRAPKAEPQQNAQATQNVDNQEPQVIRGKNNPNAQAPQNEQQNDANLMPNNQNNASESENQSALDRFAKKAAPAGEENAVTDFRAFPATKIDAVTEDNTVTEDTIEIFKGLVSDSGIAISDVSLLLKNTFGIAQAREVPSNVFEDFLDFYVEEEMENEGNLQRVINSMKG